MKKLVAMLLSLLLVVSLSGLCLAQDDVAPAPAADDTSVNTEHNTMITDDKAPAVVDEATMPEEQKGQNAKPGKPDLR